MCEIEKESQVKIPTTGHLAKAASDEDGFGLIKLRLVWFRSPKRHE